MIEGQAGQSVGPYSIVRELGSSRIGRRLLAVHHDDQSCHVLYEAAVASGRASRQRFVSAIEAVASAPGAHLLPIEKFTVGLHGVGYIVTPYTGNSDGLVTLAGLLGQNGGRMDPAEVERAVRQVLGGVMRGVEGGLFHGPIRSDELLVDRSGQVLIELYGIWTRLAEPLGTRVELLREELRSIAAMTYVLLSGLDADDPRIPVSRLSKRIDRAWDEWLDEGLNASGGFESAADAISKLPSARREQVPAPRPAVVGTMLRRFRSALAPGRTNADDR